MCADRPHLPWNSPARFIEQYGDPEQYALAKQQAYPPTASMNQWHPWFDQVLPTDVEPALKQHYLRVGYYGAVSYYDYHFGLMLDALDDVGVAQDTVVLVSGDVSALRPSGVLQFAAAWLASCADRFLRARCGWLQHGWHLGERNMVIAPACCTVIRRGNMPGVLGPMFTVLTSLSTILVAVSAVLGCLCVDLTL